MTNFQIAQVWCRDFSKSELPEVITRCLDTADRYAAAIRVHRDMAWDDRCLEDDKALYAVLDEPIPDIALPPTSDMLESCRRYIEQRGCPVADLPPGKMTIRQLESEVERLTTALALTHQRNKELAAQLDAIEETNETT